MDTRSRTMESFGPEALRAQGFAGFVPIAELWERRDLIPGLPGVYVLLTDQPDSPTFLPVGTGGFFKEKDPNVPGAILERNWVVGSPVVYIGKAGRAGGGATLRTRLGQYLDFGRGRPVGHWGGRLVWQLVNAPELLVAWKSLTYDDPRELEAAMIQKFKALTGARPFANLAD